MKFRNTFLSIKEVKNKDIVDYLLSLGFKPSKIIRNDYWYLSPFRNETTPSFKVNRNINRWYDFGEGKGGNIIDFGIMYYNCSLKDLLIKFNSTLSLQQQHVEVRKEDNDTKKIKILSDKEISSMVLIRYLHQRKIPVDIAKSFCREIDYELYGKKYFAIGFKNDSGGFELRNERFKAGSSPKDVTFIPNNTKTLTVFEGFFNFLTYQALHQKQTQPETNFLILNSAAFFEKSLPLMQSHNSVHLYLDCDATGQKCIQKAIEINQQKFIDERQLYKNYKDLNDWMIHVGHSQKPISQLKHSFACGRNFKHFSLQ